MSGTFPVNAGTATVVLAFPLAQDRLIYNQGPSVVYVDDAPYVSSVSGTPIPVGGTKFWPAGNELYAITSQGAARIQLGVPGELTGVTIGGTAFAGVTVTSGTFLASETDFTTDLGQVFASIRIRFINNGTTGTADNWSSVRVQTSSDGTSYRELTDSRFRMGPGTATVDVPIMARYVRLSVTTGTALTTRTFDITAFQTTLQSNFRHIPNVLTGFDVASVTPLTNGAYISHTPVAGSTTEWLIPVQSGDAWVESFYTGAALPTVANQLTLYVGTFDPVGTTSRGRVANHRYNTAFNQFSFLTRVIVPREGLKVVMTLSATGTAQNVQVSVTQ